MGRNMDARADFDGRFTALYRMYSQRIVRYLKRILCDQDIAEEILQEVFMKVFEKKIELEPGTLHANNYLYAMARNAAIDWLRRVRMERDRIEALRIQEAVLDRGFYESIENSYMRGEVLSTLGDVLDSFPRRERNIYIKRMIHGRRRSSVARESSLSVYRVRKTEEAIGRSIRLSLRRFFVEG